MLEDRLTEARIDTGLTQETAAHLAGLKRNSVVRYENGRRMPSLHAITALARVYGRPVGWFLQDFEAHEPRTGKSNSVDVPQRSDPIGTPLWEIEKTPVLRGNFSTSGDDGLSIDFVAVALVACVAEEGHKIFDSQVVGMVPFPGRMFVENGMEPGRCNVVKVGGTHVDGWFPTGSMVLVDRDIQTLVDGAPFLMKSADGIVIRRTRLEGVWTFSDGVSGWRGVTEEDEVIGIVRWVGHWLPSSLRQ